MEGNINLKTEIAKRVGVAITLLSFWPLYNLCSEILAGIVIAILVASCAILPFRESLSHSRWRKLAEASEFEITFTALGLGMVISGSRLLVSGFVWWGIWIILAGAAFIGAGIGENIGEGAVRLMRRTPRVTRGRKR